MIRGWLLSGMLHLAVVAAIYVGLPDFARLPAVTDVPITVDLVTDAELELAAPAAAPAKTAPEPPREAASLAKPPPPPEPEPEPKVAAAPPEPPPPPEPAPEPVEVAEPEPAPPPPEPEVTEPAPEPEPQPEPVEVAERHPEVRPPPERPTPPPRPFLKPKTMPAVARREPEPPKPAAAEPEEDPFDAFLRSVEAMPEQLQADQRREGQGRALKGTAETAARGSEGMPSLLPFEKLAVKQQIAACWRLPPGVVGTEDMVVRLRIEVGRDRQVQRVTIEDDGRSGRDPVYRAVAESAQRAVTSCGPLRLAPEKYAAWRDMVLNFRPEDAIRS